jgi:hypothetical protein
LYNFENQERRTDETLRKYKRGTDGDYRFSGAYNFVNGVKLDADDREKIRGSGFIEYADTGDGSTYVDRIYHGVKSLNYIQSSTTPYYTLVADTDEATLQAATWTAFARSGEINEVVQVYGDDTHDAGTTDFDYTMLVLVVRVRSWGYNAGETTSALTGITEFSGFSAGYGVGETLNSNNDYTIADVYGGARIAPFTGLSLSKKATAQTETGFVQADGDFTWVLANTGGASVRQCVAYLDALALQDADIDDAVATEYNGRKGRVWYARNTEGKVVTSTGLFIEGLSGSEKRGIVFTDDDGDAKTYPAYPEVQITVGTAAVADLNAWYHVFYADDFDSATAETVLNASSDPVKGSVSADAVAGKINFSKTYTADEDMVVVVEGDGGVAQAITYFTFIDSAVIAVSCIPPTDNNS